MQISVATYELSPDIPLTFPPAREVKMFVKLVRTTNLVSHSRQYTQRVPVYTKTGDKGTSSLFGNERRPKDDLIFQALGDTDELNAALGLAAEYCKSSGNTQLAAYFPEIQSRLFDVGAHVATPPSASEKHHGRTTFEDVHAQNVEKWIDHLDSQLPAIKNFILPGGGLASSQLQVCRAICRRAERSVVALGDQVSPSVLKYVNRLSDFFFVSARFAAQHDKAPEVIYRKSKSYLQEIEDITSKNSSNE
eukprot:TRINITY_DN14118_c0_g1_i1.p1 TRINITY_DN14118_c0_g1~~TRINITY_DN14118_c0_g1_i1.p1  ORF type:complete len:249 (-),score=38.06 TRINITY_DN14118_c0_g1_i1:8-754(-)